MLIGAFLDLGMNLSFLEREIAKLKLKGYSLKRRAVKRGSFGAQKFTVSLKHHHHHHHHVSFSSIKKMIERSSLSANVIKTSLAIFTVLARAEAAVHKKKMNDVHFHEVGAVDSIVDIVGVAICLEYFNIKKIFVHNINLGMGSLGGASHGRQPIPAPATAQLLEGFPVTITNIPYELVTPTGAACIAALAKALPDNVAMQFERVGCGAGDRDNKGRANIFRIFLGTEKDMCASDEKMLVKANIDDMLPLAYQTVFDSLFANGALDVWITPILMKKMRPSHELSVLCDRKDLEKIRMILFDQTTTIGIRMQSLTRSILKREVKKIRLGKNMIKVKIACLPDGSRRIYPEYEDCKRLAEKINEPFLEVYRKASEKCKSLRENYKE